MTRVVLLLVTAATTGCATLSRDGIPEGYSGTTALLEDTAIQDEGSRGTFFVAEEVDGRRVRNALIETRAASQGRGMSLSVRPYTRSMPTSSVKVTLRGTHATAAPIHEIAARAAGTFYSVSGVVEFTPKQGVVYVVTGELKKDQSCAWIVERSAKEPVTAKVCTDPSR